MAHSNTAAFGIYPDRTTAEEAVDALLRAGFRATDVSVLLSENSGTKDFAHEKHTKAPEGASLGLVVGGVVGAVLGWLTAASFFVFPESVTLVNAGPVVAVLAGFGVGALLGWLIGGLIGLGLPEYEARRYRGRVRNRGALLSVHCDNSVWLKRARKVLVETGSTDTASRSEAKADFAASDKPHHRRVPSTV